MTLNDYTALFSTYLQENKTLKEPKQLYEPIHYILDLGGKRIRPVLVLIGAEAGGIGAKHALPAALAIEIFHNFTLLHDDIMDQAPIRRGKPTVHQYWNTNTAILSGDAMLIQAFQNLNHYPSDIFKPLTTTLSQVALDVCEGQQYDMNFETQSRVSLSDYLEMIRLKTAVLLGAALKMGAIIAQTDSHFQQKIYDLGVAIGMAFQLQDDYLDTFGDEKTFGKQIGGDIQENKKTWLFLKTVELATETDRLQLVERYQNQTNQPDKYQIVRTIYEKYGIPQRIQHEIKGYTEQALQLLNELDMQPHVQQTFSALLTQLEQRNS